MKQYARCYKEYRHLMPSVRGGYIHNYIFKNGLVEAEKLQDKWILTITKFDTYTVELSEEEFNKYFKVASNDLNGYYLWSGNIHYQRVMKLFSGYGSYLYKCKCGEISKFNLSTKMNLYFDMSTMIISAEYKCKCGKIHPIEIEWYRDEKIKGNNQLDIILHPKLQQLMGLPSRFPLYEQESHLKLVSSV